MSRTAVRIGDADQMSSGEPLHTYTHTHTQCYSIVAGDTGTRARDALLPQIRHREFDLETDSTVGSTGTGGRGY